jgi:prophage antirepressor-like protein
VADNSAATIENGRTDDVISSHPIIDNLRRNQDATFVTESGMYTVILRSDSPLAKS